MREREFLNEIAIIFGRKNWADFSLDEDRKLRDLYNTLKEDLEIDICDHLELSLAEREATWADGESAGFNNGYDEGFKEGSSEGYKRAIDYLKAGKFDHKSSDICKFMGSNVNLGWTWCDKRSNLFPKYCEYCPEFEKYPVSITTTTTNKE